MRVALMEKSVSATSPFASTRLMLGLLRTNANRMRMCLLKVSVKVSVLCGYGVVSTSSAM